MISNQELVLGFYAAFDQGNFKQAIQRLAPDFTAHMAGIAEPLDLEGFTAFGLEFFNAFSQGHHQFDEILEAGDRIITSGSFRAVHQASFQGLPATGQTIEIAIMHIDRVSQGQIVEHWGQGDAQGLMQQLGIVFLPGPKLVTQAIAHRFRR